MQFQANHEIYPRAGESISLPCHTSTKSVVEWRYRKNKEAMPIKIVDRNRKITVDSNCVPACNHSITLHQLTIDDSGLYECVEGDHQEPRHTFFVNVSGEYTY